LVLVNIAAALSNGNHDLTPQNAPETTIAAKATLRALNDKIAVQGNVER
jgi:hypothetical protein